MPEQIPQPLQSLYSFDQTEINLLKDPIRIAGDEIYIFIIDNASTKCIIPRVPFWKNFMQVWKSYYCDKYNMDFELMKSGVSTSEAIHNSVFYMEADMSLHCIQQLKLILTMTLL